MIRSWNRFWFAPTSAKPLGAMRIVFGLIVLLNLALMLPDLETWFTDAGRLRGTEAKQLAGSVWSQQFNVPMRWSPLQTYRSMGVVQGVFAATAVAAVLFSLGWRTRVMGVLLYAGLLSIHHANLLTASGADCLLMIMAFLMMLSPCGAAYSLDARRQAKKFGGDFSALIAPWTQRLIAIQISIVYFWAGILKAQGKSWSDGTAMYYILNNGEARRFTLGLLDYPVFLNTMTFAAVVVEVALAFLLWVKAARPLMILLGIGLHSGIAMTINIPIFGELMMVSYLCFLTAGEWDTIVRKLDPRRRAAERPMIPGRVDAGHSVEHRGPHFENPEKSLTQIEQGLVIEEEGRENQAENCPSPNPILPQSRQKRQGAGDEEPNGMPESVRQKREAKRSRR